MVMKKAFVALLGLLLIAGAAESQVGDTKTEIRGTYFVSIEGTAGTEDGDMIRFPKKGMGLGDAIPSTADSSQAVTFCNYMLSGAGNVVVWSDACPDDSTTIELNTSTHSFPSGGWLPGFGGGIDSLRISAAAGTILYAVWGIN
jgi:hypothetical protein